MSCMAPTPDRVSASRTTAVRRSRMARTPTAASARVRPWTRAWNSSPSPRDAARLNGWSESSSSHRPAFSASNSDRVRSTMSSSTAARSSWPVSSCVTWRSARDRLTSRRARASTLAFRMSAAIAPATLRRKASLSVPSGLRVVLQDQLTDPFARARRVSWAACRRRGRSPSGIARRRRSWPAAGCGSRRASRAPGSCREPRAPGRSPPARRRGWSQHFDRAAADGGGVAMVRSPAPGAEDGGLDLPPGGPPSNGGGTSGASPPSARRSSTSPRR